VRLAAIVLVAGCSLAPAYERPAAPIPAQLPGGAGAAQKLPWRGFVRDTRLQQVIARALANNRTLKKTMLDVEAARALYRIQRSQLFPSVDGIAAVNTSRSFFGDQSFTGTTYSVQAGTTAWELDLFGKLRNGNEVKLQAYFSTAEAARAARISLVAEVATAYLALAADKSRLAIARDTMASSQRTMDLTDQLVSGGTSNRGDFWQASTVYQQARGDVASLTAAIVADRDALELLAGGPLGDALLPDALPPQLDWFADVPVGLSSSVLLERPDVLAAEHDLRGANANIGVARAELFPSLTLTAEGGIGSAALSALFNGPAFIYSVTPAITQPLFRAGAGQANVEYTEIQKQKLVAGYEYAIQNAFKEVSDALATRATIGDQLASQASLVEAAQKGFELAEARYKAGVDAFLTTLVSQRALYAAKQALIATQLAALGNRVTLYRVLGGGLE
jgi:multidrug efflux system outer membrane protein